MDRGITDPEGGSYEAASEARSNRVRIMRLDDPFYQFQPQQSGESGEAFSSLPVHSSLGDDLPGGLTQEEGGGGGGEPLSPPENDLPSTVPFAIKINGLAPTESEGVLIPATAFTISVNGGDAVFPTATATLSAPTGLSATFPSGDGISFYRIFGKVVFTRSAPTKPLDTVVGASSGITIESSDTGSFGSTTSWRKESAGYAFYFAIGAVAAIRDGSMRTARVSQIQSGNFLYSDGSDGTSSSDANGVDTRDGLRRVIICINGKPYYADIEMVNLEAVT